MHSGLPDGLNLCPLPRCSFWSAPLSTLKISSLNNKFFGHPRVSLFFPVFGHAMQYAESESPDQGLNRWPLQWKGGVLTTRPPRKSPLFFFFSRVSSMRKHHVFDHHRHWDCPGAAPDGQAAPTWRAGKQSVLSLESGAVEVSLELPLPAGPA